MSFPELLAVVLHEHVVESILGPGYFKRRVADIHDKDDDPDGEQVCDVALIR